MIPLRRYAQTQVVTASRERLMLLMIEAVPQKTANGLKALEEGRPRDASKLFLAASNIVLELQRTLDPKKGAPELCENLSKIYQFVAVRLSQAALKRDAALAHEALRVFKPIADAFAGAVAQMNAETANIARAG
jgi:flagellar protein FliS